MIISKTPYRISFFGGGTDYPAWFKKNGGQVISSTIDKYCYISCRNLPPFFDHDYRFVYSKIETVKNINEIKHPSARAVLKETGIKNGLEIHHDGDLPARSGLGSSSSFTAGFINAVSASKGIMLTKKELATESIRIEQKILRENVGNQDQIAVSYGGLNRIKFYKDGGFNVKKICMPDKKLIDLQNHLALFFTGVSRTSSNIAKHIINDIPSKEEELKMINSYVDKGINILTDKKKDILEFGSLLNDYWFIKKKLNKKISNPNIDKIYKKAIKSGAIGGKLLGAGGGGFFLFFVSPKNLSKLKKTLSSLVYVPVKFESNGSKIVLYEPDGI